MAAPNPGDLIEHRLGRMGVGRDIGHREVRGDKGVHQGGKGDQHHQERSTRCPLTGAVKDHRAPDTPDHGQTNLRRRQDQRQDQTKGPDLNNHPLVAPVGAAFASSPRHSPDAFSALVTSRGIYFSSCLANTSVARN